MYSNTSVGGEPDSGSSCWALSSRSDCACSAQETLLAAGKRPPLPGTRGPGSRQLRGRLRDQRGPLQHLATPLPAPRPRAPMRLSPRARKAGRGAWGRHGDSCSGAKAQPAARLARSGRSGSQLRADSDPRRSRRARRAHCRRRPPRGAASSLGLARGRGQPTSGPPAGGRPAGRAALPLVLHGHDEEEQQGGALHRRQQEEVVVQVAAVDVAWKREGVAAAHGHPPAGRGPHPNPAAPRTPPPVP